MRFCLFVLCGFAAIAAEDTPPEEVIRRFAAKEAESRLV